MRISYNIFHVKIFLVAAALIVVAFSLTVSHSLVMGLEHEERSRMGVWAEAMRSLNNAGENTDLSLVLKVINENNSIPVIVLDSHGQCQTFRNVPEISGNTYNDSLLSAAPIGRQWQQAGRCIKINLDSGIKGDYIAVCYDDSLLIKRLSWYPYVQLFVVLLFVGIGVFALMASKKAEENRVWVGLSKETAHQLGTPISSLMAWTEMLRESYPDDEFIPEMSKDVDRLQLIADRFSKIGSLPELKATVVNDTVEHVVQYMDRRTSSRIEMCAELPGHDVTAMMNGSLFEWVLENLSKNAADAIGTERGSITIRLIDMPDRAAIEVQDTGKGIKKKDLRNVFRPGFTTKKRGWGLGLSLARRIVEEYHHGRIWVKASEPGRGTTFRIELKKAVLKA